MRHLLSLLIIAYLGLWVFLHYQVRHMQKDVQIKMVFLEWAEGMQIGEMHFSSQAKKIIADRKILTGALEKNHIDPTEYTIHGNPRNGIRLSFASITFEKLSHFIENTSGVLVINQLSLKRGSDPGMVEGEIQYQGSSINSSR